MTFAEEREEFEAEIERHYGAYPTDGSALEEGLHALSAAHPEWTPYQRKVAGYELLAERCPVHVFRHFPFYFELDTGRARTDLGSGGVGSWLKAEPPGAELTRRAGEWWEPCHQGGLSLGWAVLDDNHHCIGNDNVFRAGLRGLIAQAQARLREGVTEEQRDFLEAAIAGNRALIRIAERCAEEAERRAAEEGEAEIRARLARIAESARRVPAEAPGTFYEALNTLLFMREVTQNLEGNGNSVLGHLDRILGPYYEADLAAGRLDPEEARELLCHFLAFSDARFGMSTFGNHNGTNTTVVIGGCDAQGRPVYNELTRMIVEIYRELRLVDPKLNARVGPESPREYLDLLAGLAAQGGNSLAVFNDEVIIEANARMGKAREDCRLYVGGGCQENLLENTEINSRASIYLNLAQVLLLGFFPEQWAYFTEREGFTPASYEGCEDFEGFYAAFRTNLRAVVAAHVGQRNRTEARWREFNPCPLHSATISDCLEQARDMMGGGARYSFGSISLTGAGTLVDALYAVKQVVYEEGLGLGRLAEILASDFAGEESLRQYLVSRVAKFGQEEEGIREFSARVFADLAADASGLPNTRGGVYEASLFSFRTFTSFGQRTGATPDGRRAGEHLSPGMSPSPLALGGNCSVGQVLGALEPLDLAAYPVVAVLDLKLPLTRGRLGPEVLTPVLLRFLEVGGSVLQLNCVDQATLREARAHPERHRDLVVRVSGYSAYFTRLPEELQEEVLARTVAEV